MAKKKSQFYPVVLSTIFFIGFLVGFLVLFYIPGVRNFLPAADIDSQLQSDEYPSFRLGEKLYIPVSELESGFKIALQEGEDLVFYDEKTWISVPGNPIELIVLNDERCGHFCDDAPHVDSFRASITPALLVRKVDVSTEEGKEILASFDIKGFPSFIFGDGIETFSQNGIRFVENPRVSPLLIEKNGRYLVDSSQIGMKFGKMISAPEIELENEPQLGDGPVKIIEFTDFQCPYCQRFHQNNKDLIDELVQKKVITLIVKDFPLSFHPEAKWVHIAANFILQKKGNEAYFTFRDEIFSTQKKWSGASESIVKNHLNTLAKKQNIDLEPLWRGGHEIYEQEISRDTEEGITLGVSGTPGIFIDGFIIPGAIGPDVLQSIVNTAQEL